MRINSFILTGMLNFIIRESKRRHAQTHWIDDGIARSAFAKEGFAARLHPVIFHRNSCHPPLLLSLILHVSPRMEGLRGQLRGCHVVDGGPLVMSDEIWSGRLEYSRRWPLTRRILIRYAISSQHYRDLTRPRHAWDHPRQRDCTRIRIHGHLEIFAHGSLRWMIRDAAEGPQKKMVGEPTRPLPPVDKCASRARVTLTMDVDEDCRMQTDNL